MSLVDKRDGAIESRKSILRSTLAGRVQQLRSLRRVTNLISSNSPLSSLIYCDQKTSTPADSEESAWLASNDLTNGRYFDDTTIPFSSLTQDDDSISASNPNRPSEHSLEQVATPAEAAPPPKQTSPPLELHSTALDDPMKLRSGLKSTSDLPVDNVEPTRLSPVASKPPVTADSPGVVPDDVAPPQPEEEAEFSDATQQLLDDEHPSRPARVVHLPESPKSEVQPSSSDAMQMNKSTTNHGHGATQADLASSPSSTVGAYSAATPMPPQDSPDTSPDSDSAEQPDEALTPKDLRPSPEEQRKNEEHDRLLEAQKDIARKQALGDVSTADDQLLYEEREAVAREAEEQAARESVTVSELHGRGADGVTQAGEAVEAMEIEKEVEQNHTPVPPEQMKIVSGPEIPNPSAEEEEEDDDMTVKPRDRAPLAVDTSASQHPVAVHTAGSVNDTGLPDARASVEVLEKRRSSDHAEPSATREDEPPLSAISPTTVRPPDAARPTSSALQTPRKPSQTLARQQDPQTPRHVHDVLANLLVLKGAADDPDRDYLESLFRIQAHDSPNVRTQPLPELVKSASKALSTEDQFISMHERVDYRLLRKIYTLQNANKWSLRQMEKAKEPVQPVSHHDHMMAEMKWMRKDFRAERKMKKSVCAWLAQRCADWVAADAAERLKMQVKVRPPKHATTEDAEQPPELDHSGESAPEDEPDPPTPQGHAAISSLIVPPELSDTISDLQKKGKLDAALKSLPIVGLESSRLPYRIPLDPVSKFVNGTVLPASREFKRKRSRFDYEDDAELIQDEPIAKRLREDRQLAPEDQEIALFHPDNKAIRDRLHANNTFRPPSEFAMPSTQFYEFRNGSQWVWEDDQKLKKLAKEYSFNWSLISDELTLPASFKSSAERRTPWECFERWVELEQLPSEMRKTMYFKTWFQRLEQSQQAAERRYQAQVAALQAANGQGAHVPTRRRTTPSRVEKRKNTRYLWLVDAMRKLTRKKEGQAYKQAEAQRAAAQRKTQNTDTNAQRVQIKTPKEFSEMRHNHDIQQQERYRQHRQKVLEAQQKQLAVARAQQQGGVQGNQQRPGSSSTMPLQQQAQMQANGQQHQSNVNGQIPQQGRPPLPIATRNGHLAVPQVNAQGIPQAQIRPNGHMQNPQDMQRIAHANVQARNAQYAGQQYAQMQPSPGNGGMSAQQQMQSNQALLANMQQQQGGQQATQQQTNGHQMSGSPSMPPPPTPQSTNKTLSSGHVPAILGIQTQLRQLYPHFTEEQINNMATSVLRDQSQTSNQTQARQNAMNAAAGINGNSTSPNMQAAYAQQQAYAQNQAAFQNNQQQMQNGNVASHVPTDASGQQSTVNGQSPQQYAAMMRQRQMQQMRLQQSPNGGHATLNGSPGVANSSPNMAPVSPVMQFSNTNNGGNTPQMAAQQRPPSRPGSATPQIQRLGSSGSLQQGMPSPGLQQGSPNMQASMAR